jgi:hypothetical protein
LAADKPSIFPRTALRFRGNDGLQIGGRGVIFDRGLGTLHLLLPAALSRRVCKLVANRDRFWRERQPESPPPCWRGCLPSWRHDRSLSFASGLRDNAAAIAPGFLSLLAPSEGQFASLLPSLRAGSWIIFKLLMQKGYRGMTRVILREDSKFLPESREAGEWIRGRGSGSRRDRRRGRRAACRRCGKAGSRRRQNGRRGPHRRRPHPGPGSG